MKYTVPNKNFNYANAGCAQTCNGKLFSTDLKINISRKEGCRRAQWDYELNQKINHCDEKVW